MPQDSLTCTWKLLVSSVINASSIEEDKGLETRQYIVSADLSKSRGSFLLGFVIKAKKVVRFRSPKKVRASIRFLIRLLIHIFALNRPLFPTSNLSLTATHLSAHSRRKSYLIALHPITLHPIKVNLTRAFLWLL